jgi:hypothetical protein
MTYLSQSQLGQDQDFQARVTAVAVEQSTVFRNDGRPAFVSLSNAILKGSFEHIQAFIRFNAAGPGMDDQVDNEDGTIDQSAITDGDLLALTQANFPVVAELYFNEDGTPKYPGA